MTNRSPGDKIKDAVYGILVDRQKFLVACLSLALVGTLAVSWYDSRLLRKENLILKSQIGTSTTQIFLHYDGDEEPIDLVKAITTATREPFPTPEKPSRAYVLELDGKRKQVFEWQPVSDPSRTCVMIVDGEIPRVMDCFPLPEPNGNPDDGKPVNGLVEKPTSEPTKN